MENGRTRYPDIFDRPRHVSATRQPMSAMERAAQFAPFAALRGYDALIREDWNYLLQFLLQEDAEAVFTCGAQTCRGRIVRYDGLNRRITLDGGQRLDVDAITDVESPAFDRFIGQET